MKRLKSMKTENNSFTQRHSGRLSGLSCWPHGRKTENSPAQQDSGNSILADGAMGLMGVMGVIGLMSGKPEKKNSLPQRDSGNSKLKVEN